MSPDYPADLERLRAIALALPEAVERTSHGSPGFLIKGGRFFAYMWHDHHGDDETAVIVKCADRDEQAMLVGADPAFYYVPAYLGPSGWVAMRVGAADTDWDRIDDRVARSWELAAPRRLLEAGGR
ncbi:MmcQ/YjbR family DNA-binding protein [Sphingomonas sp.]|uniref:MmcQ/YjbR family DNA-binding protein n=1 Tax=Sphingomonas sp. TaxID=28214 RepID=UPI003CC5582D